ncbi:MAG: class I SAM-dependent methyltransferase, partial [Phycisphaerales bacterium]
GRIAKGRIRLADGSMCDDFGQPAPGYPDVRVQVTDARFYGAVALGGSTGAGEAYTNGWWTTDDLVGLIRLFVLNGDALSGIDSGWARLSMPLYRLARLFSRNTTRGSKRNIAAHYDLSNDFFTLWLDRSMMYSSAIYPDDRATLEDAQAHKLRVIGRKLGLSAGDHLLEIGTGWGSLAITAARDFGCRVTTTTISAEQARYARAAVTAAGLADRVRVETLDYRELERAFGAGSFTKLASIEMVEAVGADHLDTYLSTCSRMLGPDGLALIQAILIRDQRYAAAQREPDFIQKHIFPGSFIPSHAVIAAAAARVSEFTIAHYASFGEHYARTLREWRARFMDARDRVAALGFDDRFQRMWEFYLAYCEGAFAERHITVGQFVFRKPGDRVGAECFEHGVRG